MAVFVSCDFGDSIVFQIMHLNADTWFCLFLTIQSLLIYHLSPSLAEELEHNFNSNGYRISQFCLHMMVRSAYKIRPRNG